MKIQLQPNFIAILTEDSEGIIGTFKSTIDAKSILENAVREHYDCDVTLIDDNDFIQPIEYNQPYLFHIHNESEEGYYITCYLTYAPIY